jgi:hypothetical protein
LLHPPGDVHPFLPQPRRAHLSKNLLGSSPVSGLMTFNIPHPARDRSTL